MIDGVLVQYQSVRVSRKAWYHYCVSICVPGVLCPCFSCSKCQVRQTIRFPELLESYWIGFVPTDYQIAWQSLLIFILCMVEIWTNGRVEIAFSTGDPWLLCSANNFGLKTKPNMAREFWVRGEREIGEVHSCDVIKKPKDEMALCFILLSQTTPLSSIVWPSDFPSFVAADYIYRTTRDTRKRVHFVFKSWTYY